MKVMAVMDMQV